MISDKIRVMDEEVIDAYSKRQDFNGLAQYYFEQYKIGNESYSEKVMLFYMRRAESSEWSQRVEEAVLMALANSRSYSLDAVAFDEMPQPAKDTIDKAQEIFDKYFSQLLGRDFPLNLRETVFLTPRYTEHPDPISKRAYIERDSIRNLRRFIRVVIHENIHLTANDDSFLRYNLNVLWEGLIEYLTQRIIDLAEQDGMAIEYEFQSELYIGWVEAMEGIIFDYLFEGDDSPFIDFYNSGDIITLAIRISEAIERKGENALEEAHYGSRQAPVIRDINKIISLLQESSLERLFIEDREALTSI